MVTGTPVVFVGMAVACRRIPSMRVMLASETAGRPLGKFAATASCCEPADMSVIVPLMVIGVAVVTPTSGAVTVSFGWSFTPSVYLVVVCV